MCIPRLANYNTKNGGSRLVHHGVFGSVPHKQRSIMNADTTTVIINCVMYANASAVPQIAESRSTRHCDPINATRMTHVATNLAADARQLMRNM